MSDYFFRESDLATWTGGNADLVRSMRNLAQTVTATKALEASDVRALKASIDALTATLNAQKIESGSNANGVWIKYPDGTLVQYGATTIYTDTYYGTSGFMYASADKNITFPIPFVGAIPVVPQPGVSAAGSTGIGTLRSVPPTLTVFTANVFGTNIFTTYQLTWVAFGRYK